MDSTAVLILAAGKGTRMALELPKVAVRTEEKALIQHVLSATDMLPFERTIVVTGFQEELVQNVINEGFDSSFYANNKIEFAHQAEQHGTGHAVKCSLDQLKDFTGTVLILFGDVPLVQAETLSNHLKHHEQDKATITLLTFQAEPDSAYGRIVRNSNGQVEKIVQAKDCSANELLNTEVDSGIYAVDSSFLIPAIESLTNDNAQGEYYLTDIVEKAIQEGQAISTYSIVNSEELLGVNDPLQLSQVNQILRRRRAEALILNSVSLADPASFYCDPGVKISSDVKIGPNVQLRGNTSVEKGVVFEGSAYISNCKIDAEALIRFGVRAENAIIGSRASVGPFAHLREGTNIGPEVRLGNFVETKKSTMHKGSKAPHLTYLGDTTVGEAANIGAGTITCNYDGVKKSPTEIGEKAFIGSNSSLVAPVKIGAGATVGAGSVITKDVEPNSLALTRAPQKSQG